MSDDGDEAAGTGPNALADFFADAGHPPADRSTFTPEDVAHLIRHDRDAST